MLRRLIDLMTGPRIPRVPVPRLKTEADGSGGEFTQVMISDDPDEKLFAYLAAVLQEKLNGRWSQQLTGLDQAYWDLESGDGKIVLHLEHYLGISLHPHGLSQATNASKALVLEAYKAVALLGPKSESWISKSIVCEGQEVSPGLDWDSPLLPNRAEVGFKISLVMKSWEMCACEGRQLSPEDFELMERYAERLKREDLDEGSLRAIIDDFGTDLSGHLEGKRIQVDARAMTWVKRH